METTTARNDSPFPTSDGAIGNGMLDKAAAGTHAAIDKAASVADDAVRRAKPTLDRMTQTAHQAVDKAAQAAAPRAEWLGKKSETVVAAQKKLIEDTCQYVAENPLKSIGVTLAIGFLLGRLIPR